MFRKNLNNDPSEDPDYVNADESRLRQRLLSEGHRRRILLDMKAPKDELILNTVVEKSESEESESENLGDQIESELEEFRPLTQLDLNPGI